MRERSDLAMVKRLASIQRARRVGAEAAMAAAAAAERDARRTEEAAVAKSRAAQRQWNEYLAEPGFSPEFSRALSAILVAREDEAVEAGRETGRRAEAHVARTGEWQQLEAEVQLSEASLRRLRRKVARKQEEKAMAVLADRTTWSWRQP